ncbi:MAG: DUF637 domain-containing protein [Sideroxyarcus sp.]
MQNRQHTELTTDQSPSRARQAVAWLTLIAYIGQPMAATAQVIAAQNAAAQNRPVIDNTANGIPLVQIVSPNAAGISHNKFTQYNVDPSGLILNNSNAAVQTQQAGYVSANPNMAGGTARIILNEVTSTSQSQLNGYTEVAGTRAEVIIANPNGITCNGCGFINASRGVLTTGTPVFGSFGSLDSFRVTGGQITVGSGGLIDSSTDQLDLIARSVKVNDTLWANNNLNVITGTNQVNYANLGVQVITGDANKPTVGIDVAQLGGMYANKIKLIGTETGVGVNSQGTLAAQAGDFTLDNQGQITLAGATSASGNLTITGVAGTSNSGTLYSEQNVLITDHGAITNSGILSARGNLTLDGASISSSGTLGAGIVKDGTVVLTNGTDTRQGVMKLIATNQIDATGQNIAGTGLSMAGTTINLANSQAMVGGGGATLTATAGDIINTGGTFQSLGSLTLNAAGGVIDNTGGTIASALDTTVTTNTVTGTGKIIAGRDATISIKGDYTNALGNVIKANRDLTFTTTGAFTNLATLESLNKLTLNASNLDNQTSAIINAGDTTLNIGTGSITNAGRIEGNTLTATSDSFANTGTVIGDNLTLNASTITNSGASAIIVGTQSVNLAVKNSLLNQGGATIYSYLGDINIGADLTQDADGFLIGNTGSVTNTSSTIEAGGNLRISADQLINERTFVGVEWGSITSQSVVTGTLGSPGAPGAPSYTANYADEKFMQGTTDAGQLLAGANVRLNAATVTNNYSDIIAGQTLKINSPVVNNIGDPFKQRMTVTNGTRELWSYVETGWHWGVKCNWKGCWPTRVPEYGWIHYPVAWTQAASVYTPATNPTQYTKAVVPTLVIGMRGDSQTPLNKAGVPDGSGTTLTVPASGLYTIHNQPGQPYLVVTDPRFANYQNFVSSDYMLSRLALDPGMIQKRLGDGFYEQKLVTDQVTQLTGRRYLGQSASAEEQFKELMLSGVAVAKEFKLILGVGLTKEQMAALTTDIVWMVEQTVALPSGGTTKVLAPQVYLSQLHAGDLKPSGALLAAEAIDINTAAGTLMNSGTIRSTSATNIAAQDIMNLGGTIGSSGTINLQAVNDIVNRSGKIAGNNVNLSAGRDVINERTAKETTTTVVATTSRRNGLFDTIQSPVAGNSSNTELGLETGITAADGLNITAGRDISIVAANLKAGGNASLNATENITVGTIAAQQKNTGAYNSYINTVTNQTSQIDIGGNLDMKAGNNLQMTAAKVNAGKDLTLQAGGNIDLKAAKDSTAFGYDSGVAQESKYDETVIGTTLNAGGNVTLAATNANADRTTGAGGDNASAGDTAAPGTTTGRADGKGNIKLENATINSKGTLAVVADGNVEITTVDEKHEFFRQIVTESQGLISSTTTTSTQESSSTSAKGSNLTGTNVVLQAGDQTTKTGDITIKGSNIAATETVSIDAGRDLQILSAEDSASSSTSEVKTRDGFTVGSSGLEYGKKNTNTVTDGSTTQVSSNITGNTVVTQSGNDTRISASNVKSKENTTLYAGSNLYIESVANTIRHNQETTESKIGMNVAMMDGRLHDISVGTNGKITEDGNTTSTQVGSQIGSEGSVNLLSGNSMMIIASKLKAGKDMNLNAGGDIVITGQYDQTATENSTATRMSSMKSKDKTADQTQNYTFVGSSLDAGDNLNIRAGNNIDFTAANLSSGADTNLTAEEGQVRFLTQKNINIVSQTVDDEDLVYEVHKGKGRQDETLVYTKIKTGGTLNVDAAKGVVVEVDEVPAVPVAEETTDENGQVIPATPAVTTDPNITPHPTFSASTAALAKQPGMEWMGQMLKRDDVDWKKVAAAHDSWDYKNQNLTEAGAIILVVVVTVFTAGTASSAAGAVTTTTGSAAVGAAAGAAVTSLATTAALSFANNGGDLGKTLNDLGKRENIRGLLTAMVTAGVLKGVGGTQLVSNVSNATNLPVTLVNNTINGALTATINTAINGGSLQDQLGNALLMALINTAGEKIANTLHTDDKSLTANINNKLGHALLGCGMEAAQKKDCLSGAVGGVAGELAGEFFAPDGSKGMTSAQKDKIINLSKLIAGGVAMVAGLDVNAAMNTASNAVANNRLMTPKEIKWIDENAQKYADENDLTLEEAKLQLGQQAARNADATAATYLGATPDTKAQAYLDTAQGSFINESGEKQALFTNKPGDYMNGLMYAADVASDPNSKAFYKQYVQPGMTNSIGTGLNELAQVHGAALPGAVYEGLTTMVVGMASHPIDTGWSMVTGAWDGLLGAGNSLGGGVALLADDSTQNMLDSIYGRSDAHLLAGAFSLVPATAMIGGAAFGGTIANAAGKATVKVAKATTEMAGDAAKVFKYADNVDAAPKVFNGVELHPDLPSPSAGYDYSPDMVSGAKTENQLYSHWTGLQAEAKLANEVAGQGEAVVKWGDKIGAQGNDIISVDPKTGGVTLWDSKYRSGSTTIEQSPTYVKRETRAAAVSEAQRTISGSNLPQAVKDTALQNLEKGDYTTNTVGSGGAKNSYQVRYCNGKPC